MRKSVRILNSRTGSGYTSRKNAERYVTRGVARWDASGNAIVMIEADYRFCSERAAARNGPRVPVSDGWIDPRLPNVAVPEFWDGRGVLRFWKDQQSVKGIPVYV